MYLTCITHEEEVDDQRIEIGQIYRGFGLRSDNKFHFEGNYSTAETVLICLESAKKEISYVWARSNIFVPISISDQEVEDIHLKVEQYMDEEIQTGWKVIHTVPPSTMFGIYWIDPLLNKTVLRTDNLIIGEITDVVLSTILNRKKDTHTTDRIISSKAYYVRTLVYNLVKERVIKDKVTAKREYDEKHRFFQQLTTHGQIDPAPVC